MKKFSILISICLFLLSGCSQKKEDKSYDELLKENLKSNYGDNYTIIFQTSLINGIDDYYISDYEKETKFMEIALVKNNENKMPFLAYYGDNPEDSLCSINEPVYYDDSNNRINGATIIEEIAPILKNKLFVYKKIEIERNCFGKNSSNQLNISLSSEEITDEGILMAFEKLMLNSKENNQSLWIHIYLNDNTEITEEQIINEVSLTNWFVYNKYEDSNNYTFKNNYIDLWMTDEFILEEHLTLNEEINTQKIRELISKKLNEK